MCVSHAKCLEFEVEPLLWSAWMKLNDWQWTDKPNPCSSKEIPPSFCHVARAPFLARETRFCTLNPGSTRGSQTPASWSQSRLGGEGGMGAGETKEFRHLCDNWIYVSDLSILTVKKESWRRFGGGWGSGTWSKEGTWAAFAASCHICICICICMQWRIQGGAKG